MQHSLGELLKQIRQERDCGRITLAAEARLPASQRDTDTASLLAAADIYVARFGFTGQGAAWRTVNQSLAARIIELILRRDLAYGGPLLKPETAQAAARTFFDLFAPPSLFLTNSHFDSEGDPAILLSQRSWTPITDATFDTGIIAVNTGRVGIFWAEDED